MASLGKWGASAADWISSGRYWKWRVGVAALSFSALHALPAYDAIDRATSVRVIRLKGLHPLTHFASASPASHEAKLDFRLVAPLLLRPFHAAFVPMVLLYALSGAVVYAILAGEIVRGGRSVRTAFVAVSGLAVTAAGGTFLLGYQYFDGLAIALAASATVLRRHWPLAATLAFLALYTDERAGIALVLGVAASGWIDDRQETKSATRLTWTRLFAIFIAYGGTRVILQVATALRSETAEVGLSVVRVNASRLPVAIAFAFAAWWLVIVSGLWRVARENSLLVPCLAVVAFGSALLVDDVTRSLAYLLPLAPVAAVSFCDGRDERKSNRWLTAVFAVCALTPAVVMVGTLGHFNPLPVQLVRHIVGSSRVTPHPSKPRRETRLQPEERRLDVSEAEHG